MDSSLVLSSYSSRLNLSLSNSPPMIFMTKLPKGVMLPVSGRLGIGSIPGLKGLRVQMGSNLSTSLVSISKRRNPKVSCTVSEVQETVVDLPPVTDGTWESFVLKADGPVLVEFWAPWCGPCRIIHPEIAELSIEYAGKIKFFKLNTDESPSIATKYGIRSIPTIMIFNNGQKKDAVIGAVPKTTLTSTIEKFL